MVGGIAEIMELLDNMRIIVMKIVVFAVLGLLSGVVNAATATSNEARLDLRGMGPWERRVARPTETIQYSTVWATNLTAAQQAEAKALVKVYPCLKEKPKYIAIDLSGGTTATRYPIEYLDEIPGGSWSDEYKTSKLVLRHIPAGSFIMGGRNTDYPGAANTNLHMVTLTKDFYMGVFEVTQRQWELVMGTRPAFANNPDYYAARPIEQVSFTDIRGEENGILWPQSRNVDPSSFMFVLRKKTNDFGFDLPTSAQWEYACRAGTTTALNDGTNLESNLESANLLLLGRYRFNSGVVEAGNDWDAAVFYNCTSEKATATVGSYRPNNWGLFDMHGNVFEWCLDRWGARTESIDPVGCSTGNRRVLRSGSWNTSAYGSSSGCVYEYNGYAPEQVYKARTMGFRICLHDATARPSTDFTTILVNAAGAGVADWTPTQTGTYQLTYEVLVDGTTVAPMERALFTVEGPELKIEPMGELEPGVEVVVKPSFAKATEGDSGEWTVYYSLDGTEPTAASTVYSGAITLNETTTVRAVAINAQGVRSEEASATFTLHDQLGIASAVATPRFPWNGKVDVDVELKGDPAQRYLVEVEARDLAGGTNLPVRTVACTRPTPHPAASNVQPSTFNLQPGSHRLTWDAAADIAGDYDFARVAVTVKATGSHLLAYPKTLELTVAGYTGTEVLTNVPTLVRLSTAIPGFSYSGFATTNGADLAFFTPEGRPLPYEIDEWNTNGESLVWVRLPVFANGTRFTAAWGRPATNNQQPTTSNQVWREYAGVWHMNEPSGTAFDSTEHHLDGIPSCGTNELADVSQMVAYENGACGRARVNAIATLKDGNAIEIPSYDCLGLGCDFTLTGWFWANEVIGYPRLFSRKCDDREMSGFELLTHYCDPIMLSVRGSSYPVEGEDKFYVPNLTDSWTSMVLVYHGGSVDCYSNGVKSVSVNVASVIDNGRSLKIGGGTGYGSFAGQYDEIRLRGGSLSADRIKADYDMIANREFLSYGAVRSGCEEAVK